MCEVGADLLTMIRASAAAASAKNNEAYQKKAVSAVEKLNDFMGGRWATSPWWAMQEGETRLPALANPCPVLQW